MIKFIDITSRLVAIVLLAIVIYGGWLVTNQLTQIQSNFKEVREWKSKIDNRFRLFEQYDGGQQRVGQPILKQSSQPDGSEDGIISSASE